MAKKKIEIYDTTLRDGTQSEGFTLSGIDKVRIAKRLDAIGMAFIEGGSASAVGTARASARWSFRMLISRE